MSITTKNAISSVAESIIPNGTNHYNSTQYIVALARTFPLLRRKLVSYNPDNFIAEDFLEICKAYSDTERHCAMFIVNVWSHSHAKREGWIFDMVEFCRICDDENYTALLDWMSHPFLP